MDRSRTDSEILTYAPDTKSYTEFRYKQSQLRFNNKPRVVVHQKRAIFVRITGIAMKASGDFTQWNQKQGSQAASKIRLQSASRHSLRERKSSTALFKRNQKVGLFRNQRGKMNSQRVSISDAVDEYLTVSERNKRLLTLEDTRRKVNNKNNVVALEEEARHIDEIVYKSSTENTPTHGRFREEETVAAIWRDMGIDVVQSQRDSSLLEIVLPQDQKLDVRRRSLYDKRKSTLYRLVFGELDVGSMAKKDTDHEIQSTDTDEEEFFDARCDLSPQNVNVRTRSLLKTKDPSKENMFNDQTRKAQVQTSDRVLSSTPSENLRKNLWRSLSKGTTFGSTKSLRQLAPNILSFKTSKSSLPTDTARISVSKSQTPQKPTNNKSSTSVGSTAAVLKKLPSEKQVVKTIAHNHGKSVRAKTEETSEKEEFFDALEMIANEKFRPPNTKYVKLVEKTKLDLLDRQPHFPHSSTSPHPLDIRWHSSHADNDRFKSTEELSEAEWIRLKETREKTNEQNKSGCSIN